jgi:hypothetical protein
MEEFSDGSLQVSFEQNIDTKQSVVDIMSLSDYQEDLRVLL